MHHNDKIWCMNQDKKKKRSNKELTKFYDWVLIRHQHSPTTVDLNLAEVTRCKRGLCRTNLMASWLVGEPMKHTHGNKIRI